MPRRADLDRTLPSWLVTSGAVAWRVVAVAAALWTAVLALRLLTVVVVPVLLALLLTAVLHPMVRRAPDTWPSWPAPLAAVLVVGAVVVGAITGLGVRIAEQLPEFRDDYRSFAVDVEDGLGIELPDLPGGDAEALSDGSDGTGSTTETDSAASGSATEIIGLGAEILFGFFLTLALAFLFLKDGRVMWTWALDKVGDRGDGVDRSGRAAWSTLGSYVRGLTVVAAFDAVGIGLGLLALGVPMVATLAALQFLASYVPTIGAFTAGGAAVFIAYVDGGVTVAALTLAVVIVVQQIGNSVIEPWIMGRTMPLHPAMVLIVVTLGAVVWGIAGALLFVPMAAGLSAVGHEVWQNRRPTP